jgi:endoglucanase
MMNLVENLRVANSRYRKDVPDACIRQVQTDETKPFTRHTIPGQIDASDFDLGKNGYAYFDTQVADYNLSTGTFQPWNSGWSYRNDGVDIERSQDPMSNGFNVGFTEKGEWMKYTVNVAESGVYRITTRVATESSDAKIHFTINDQSVTPSVDVARTGGWQTYEELVIEDVLLEEGMHGLKIQFDAGSLNLTNFTFEKTGEIDNPDFQILTGEIGEDGQSIELECQFIICFQCNNRC